MIYDVVLNPGHGGTDPGAVVKGVKEKDKVLKVAKCCKEELENHGLSVLMTRTKDESEGSNEIIRECNNSGAKVAVSFHLNVDADPETLDYGAGDGGEVFYWKTSREGKKLAKSIEKRYKALGQNSRGCKTADLFFTRETIMPAILVEMWFMDNKKDRAIGDTEKELKAWGVAIAKGILDYLGYVEYVTLTSLNHRSKAGFNKSKVYNLVPKNTRIHVIRITKDGWGKCYYKGKTGYVRIKDKSYFCKKL